MFMWKIESKYRTKTGKDRQRQAPLYQEEEGEVEVNMEEGNLLKARYVASLDSRSQTEQDDNEYLNIS